MISIKSSVRQSVCIYIFGSNSGGRFLIEFVSSSIRAKASQSSPYSYGIYRNSVKDTIIHLIREKI